MGLFGKPSAEKTEQIYQKGHNARKAKDYYLAAFNLNKAAKQGHVPAMMENAWMHYSGEMGERKYMTALEWFEKAAKQGSTEAQIRTAAALRSGAGVEKDIQKAISWYERAAKQGDPEAMYELGCLYLAGESTGVPIGPCLTNAKYWFHAAAEHGYKDAGEKEETVKRLRGGLGSHAYLVSGKHTAWMEKMAENGNGHACLNVGRFRVQEHNDEEAFALFRRGAAAGNGDCAYECGLACRDGAGVEKDDGQAFQWFRRAAKGGSREAVSALKRLGEEV